MGTKEIIITIYIAYLVILSLVTFILYGADKKKAKTGGWRIKEKTLLLMSVLGGAFGGFAAMQIYRHKTKGEHWYFTVLNLLGIILHIAIIVLLYIKL